MGKDLSIAGAEADADLAPEFSYEELIDEIYSEFHVPDLAAGEFTPLMYAQRKGVSLVQATCEIKAAVTAGRLEEAGERMAGGRKRLAYRRRVGE